MSEVFYCIGCGEIHNGEDHFYLSTNPIHKNGRTPYCKEFIKNYVSTGADTISIDRLKNILRQVDRPYIHSVYVSSVEDNRETVGTYFSKINSMNQYKESTWIDSVFDVADDESSVTVDGDFYVTKEMEQRWGFGLSEGDYQFLESFYKKYTDRLEDDSPAEISLVIHICRAELNAYKANINGTSKEYKDAVAMIRSLMGDLKLTPNQQESKTEAEETFGKFIDKIENEEPIPEWDDKVGFKDSVMQTVRVMISHIAKMMGKESPFQKEYDDYMTRHGVAPNMDDEKNG